MIWVFSCNTIDSNVQFHGIMTRFPTHISMFLLRFSYPLRPRAESATFWLATRVKTIRRRKTSVVSSAHTRGGGVILKNARIRTSPSPMPTTILDTRPASTNFMLPKRIRLLDDDYHSFDSTSISTIRSLIKSSQPGP